MSSKVTSWFWGLSKFNKAAVVLIYFVILGGAIGIAADSYSDRGQSPTYIGTGHVSQEPPQTLSAVVEKQLVMKFDEELPFKKKTVKDPTLPEGQSYIRTAGVNGKRNVTYEITYTDGVETDRKVLEEEILEKPEDEVTVVGTYKAPESESQIQGAHTKKETNEGIGSLESPANELELPARKVYYWNEDKHKLEKICITSDDVRYNSPFRVNKEEYENLAACEAD